MEISLYPNPATDKMTLLLPEPVKGKICIYDYSGKEVKTLSINGNTLAIDLLELAAGSYFINIMEDNKLLTSKMFIKE